MLMNRLLCTLLLFLTLAFCVKANDCVAANDSVPRARSVEYYYMQAVSYLEQGEYDAAYEMFEHCRSIDPSSTAVLHQLSTFYLVLDRDSLAHDMLSRIVQSEPHNPDYLLALVNYYNKIGDNKAAISLYEDMLGYSGSKSDIYTALYALYSEEGMTEKAVNMLEMLEKAEGRSEEISLQKLHQYMQLPDSVKSVELVAELMAASPDEVAYISLMGDVYLYLGDLAKAENYYLTALSKEPDEAVTLSSLSSLYNAQGKDSLFFITTERLLKSEKLDVELRLRTLVEYVMYRENTDSAYVMDLFREMMHLPFDQLEISETYADYLKYRNAPADSIKPVLERIIVLEPENVQAMVKLLLYAIEEQDYEKVVYLCDNAMMYIPELLELYYYKGLSSYFLNRKSESVSAYELGLLRRSDDTSPDLVSTVYSVLGDTYHELDMHEKCTVAYDSALVYNPRNLNVLNNYAYYLSLAGSELDKALEMSRRTIEAEPENSIYLDTYAWILFLLERYEEAKAYAEKLIGLNEEMGSVELHHCGDIYAKCGDIARAVEYWEKAAAAGDDSKILKKKIKKRKYYRNAKNK